LSDDLVVRSPGSSANLGAGFDVFGMALDLYADVGTGTTPNGAQPIDEHHPGRAAFSRLGGTGDIWLRCNIPMARGLGFSGAVRVAAAGLAAVQSGRSIVEASTEILRVTIDLEGHGDNVAASLFGGVTACVGDRSIPFPLGPVLGNAAFVAWIPDLTTSTDSSRRALLDVVSRNAAIHNIGRAAQLALAFAHDDPALLVGATDDQLHQAVRLLDVPGAQDALDAGVEAGAWCGWLSGSGPTVGFLVERDVANAVAAAMPSGAHTKVLAIDRVGTRLVTLGR
jgi:homoserine kinase